MSKSISNLGPNSRQRRYPNLYKQHIKNSDPYNPRIICTHLQTTGYHIIKSDLTTKAKNKARIKKCLDLKNEIRQKFEAGEGPTTIFDHFGEDLIETVSARKDRIMMLANYKSGEEDEWADLPFKDWIKPVIQSLRKIQHSSIKTMWRNNLKDLNMAFILSEDNSIIQPLHSDFGSKSK
jgi:hypothetical protein